MNNKRKGQGQEETIFSVRVQPRAGRNEILGFREESLRVRVTAAPADGEANLLCRRVLAEALGVSLSQVEILSGHRGRHKRVRITGLNEPRWQSWRKAQEGRNG
ncbi:MAG: DUF167 domain-containing protein [Deltaproteobacteria bacterium]|nr:DUF167 domain-containing protein [Deltaproteobacteria bacterium]